MNTQETNFDKTSPVLPIYIGCPVWNCEDWSNIVFPVGTKRPKWLGWYSQMFNCAEGNSSFYGIPSLETARRWGAESANGFRFCMKFPREISHDRALIGTESKTSEFLLAIEELARADRLGPTFLQLGPNFGADRFDALARFLSNLPREYPWGVEVRHLSWFDNAVNEQRLDELLQDLAIDKVIFDSRPLNQTAPDDESEKQSQTRKPKTPLRTSVTGQHPMLRLIGRNRVELVDSYLEEWVPIIDNWVTTGLQPHIFTHTPNDAFAPALARRLWEKLRMVLPGNYDSLPLPPRQPRQLEWF